MAEPPFTILRGAKPRGESSPTHRHAEAQLTFAASGTIQVHTDEGRWLVPPQLAVWIPAGVPHRAEVLADAEFWVVHWRPAAARDWAPDMRLDRTFALGVTPLLRALLAAVFTPGTRPEKAELAARLMLHELGAVAQAPTFLPLPASPAGRRVAELALDDPRNGLGLGELASRAATSVRTVSRIFPAETGLTFKAWRQRARIVHAIERLGRGDTIARAAAATGFASTAAFSCAFRQVTDMTPTTFLGQPAAMAEPMP